jgi:hypothetical protein
VFDPKCYELAEYFLPPGAPDAAKDRLAQHLQEEIEMWLQYGEGSTFDKIVEPEACR